MPWWSILEDVDDPITLEPISSLSFAPFTLTVKNVSFYFDAVALSQYAIATSKFINPLTRDAFDRSDCKNLDEHIKKHCGPRYSSSASVEKAFVYFNSNDERSDTLRQVAAAALQNLFAFRSTNNSNNYNANTTSVIDDNERVVSSSSLSVDDFPTLHNNTLPPPPDQLEQKQKQKQTLSVMENTMRKIALEEEEKQRSQAEGAQQKARDLKERLHLRQQNRAFHENRINENRLKVTAELKLQDIERSEVESWRARMFEKAEMLTKMDFENSKLRDLEVKKKLHIERELQQQRQEDRAKAEAEEKISQQQLAEVETERKLREKKRLKREKEKGRKNEKKRLERLVLEEKEKEAAMAKRREESVLKCACCGDGIPNVKNVFEKFGKSFCRVQCAKEVEGTHSC